MAEKPHLDNPNNLQPRTNGNDIDVGNIERSHGVAIGDHAQVSNTTTHNHYYGGQQQSFNKQPKGDVSPYMGLRYFDKEHSHLYFGREALVEEILSRLPTLTNKLTNANRKNFLPIIGASGSGKSSLVRAGLLPKLELQGYQICLIVPSDRPLENLAVALTHDNESVTAVSTLIDDMQCDQRSLHLHIKRLTKDGKPFLLVVDQFEELFTTLPKSFDGSDPTERQRLIEAKAERQQFVENLMYTVEAARNGMVTVIITLRADFLSYCNDYPTLWKALENQPKMLPVMTRAELTSVIVEPAVQEDYTLSVELVKTILRDCGVVNENDRPQASVLPLLSHALHQMWVASENRELTLQAYDAAGRVQGAIAKTADSVLAAEALSDQDRIHIKQIFLQLTELGEGSEDTRRRVSRAMLADVPDMLLTHLANKRLIIVGDDFVEVSHEALIREWQQLRAWLADNREALRRQRRIARDSEEWESHGYDHGFLYRGFVLDRALEWLEGDIGQATKSERIFIEAAERQRQQIEQDLNATRKREHENTLQLVTHAQQQKRLNNALRRLAYGLTILTVIAVAVSIFAVRQSKIVEARSLLSRAQNAMTEDYYSLAALLALESNQLESTNSAIQLIGQIPYTGFTPFTSLTGHTDTIYSLAWDHNSDRLVSASGDGTIKIWDMDSQLEIASFVADESSVFDIAWNYGNGRLAFALGNGAIKIWDADSQAEFATLAGHTEGVYSVAWEASTGYLASGSIDGVIKIWDVDNQIEIASLIGHTEAVRSVIWDTSTRRLASASFDRTIKIWDVNKQTEIASLEGHTDTVTSIAWEYGGDRLASGSADETVKIWDVNSQIETASLAGHTNTVYSVIWNENNGHIASASSDGIIKVWDTDRQTEIVSLMDVGGSGYGIAWDRDGDRLASASYKKVKIWDIASQADVVSIDAHVNGVRSTAWADRDELLATGSFDGSIKVWDVDRQTEVASFIGGHKEGIPSIAWDVNNNRLASASWDGTIKVWDVDNEIELVSLDSHTNAIRSVAWDAKRGYLASGSDDQTVKVWDVNKQTEIVSLLGHTNVVWSVAWDNNSGRLASGSADGTIKIWDVDDQIEIASIDGRTDIVWSVAWDATGRRLASGSHDGTVRIWDVVRQTEIASLKGHTASIYSLEWNTNDGRLASGSVDGTIKIWDIENQTEITTLVGHTDAVLDISWSDISGRLASVSSDGTVMILSDRLIQPICEMLDQNFSATEWKRYRGQAIYRAACPNLSTPELSIFEYPWLTWRGRLTWGGVAFILTMGIGGIIVWIIRLTTHLSQR